MSEVNLPVTRGPLRSLTGVQIIGTGSFVPDNVVRNEDLAKLGFDADWIVQRTGIRERRHAPPDMATSDMSIIAAQRAIESAGVDPSDIDLVVLGTFSPDHLLPATACIIQDRLNLHCPAMDVQAACAGFLYAIVTGMQFVATGSSKLALVIGADTNSRVMNPADMKTYPLFGDGAGAVLITAGSPEQGLLAYTLGADGSGAELLWRSHGGSRSPLTASIVEEGLHFVQMDGRPVFKWAIRLLQDTIDEVLAGAKRKRDDVDLWVLHQANLRIIDAVVDNMALGREKIVIHVERYGNTSSASVPIALDEAMRDGKIQPGTEVMLSGFGAGLSWGTALCRW